nr:hypothetical protein [Allomuricauda sp.]
MTKNHEDLERDLKSILQSGPLSSINFYQVNDNFFELNDEGYWVIDAGIELTFPGGVVSAALSTELESFVIENKSVTQIYTNDNFHLLENDNILGLRKYLGLHIVDVKFESLEFEYIVDYTMRTEKEKRFVQMILEFQNKSIIQIAFVDYSLKEGMAPSDFSFDLQTDLLVSTKKIMEIKA